MSKEKSTKTKKRNWAFVLYPESAPVDWREQLQLSGVVGVVSPLHDKDTNPTGEPKKAHYHIILVYGSPTTYNNVKSLTDRLNSPIPQPLENIKGYYRYLTHKDNPEKYQYSDNEITCINGFNISDYVELTKAEVFEYKKKIQQFIRDNNITEYCELLDELLDRELLAELEIAQNNTLLFNSYIKSKKYKRQEIVKNIVCNKDTGEVIE